METSDSRNESGGQKRQTRNQHMEKDERREREKRQTSWRSEGRVDKVRQGVAWGSRHRRKGIPGRSTEGPDPLLFANGQHLGPMGHVLTARESGRREQLVYTKGHG